MGEPAARAADRRAVKILRIHLEASITALTTCGPYVVSGGSGERGAGRATPVAVTVWDPSLAPFAR